MRRPATIRIPSPLQSTIEPDVPHPESANAGERGSLDNKFADKYTKKVNVNDMLFYLNGVDEALQ